MGNLPIAVMQECQQQTPAPHWQRGPRDPRVVPWYPSPALDKPPQFFPGTGRKFQTRLGNKTAQDALLRPRPAQCATRPCLAVPPTLPACCPPTAAAWPWPPFSCWVGRAHSLCAANCSSSGGRVEAAALFLTKNGLRFSRPAATSFQFCQGWHSPFLARHANTPEMLPTRLPMPFKKLKFFMVVKHSSGYGRLVDISGKWLHYDLIQVLDRAYCQRI